MRTIIINGLDCERLECEHCGSDCGLFRITNLSDNKILCIYCLGHCNYEELGIEPMDKE